MIQNLILASLDDDVRSRVLSEGSLVDLERSDLPELATQLGGVGISSGVLLPITAVLSARFVLADGFAPEVLALSSEDCTAMVDAVDAWRTVVQASGSAWLVAGGSFRALMEDEPSLRRAVFKNGKKLLASAAVIGSCNRAHPLSQRAARWLLSTADHTSEQIVITHEELAVVLGVQRPSVSLTLEELERAGLIEGRRGRINITDRTGLERASCDCHAMLRALSDRALASVD